ncbi:kinase-like protein [Hypoxylon sp. FL0890]|nr:kinase-like protein [Hypoxylon sp. FL0890]
MASGNSHVPCYDRGDRLRQKSEKVSASTTEYLNGKSSSGSATLCNTLWESRVSCSQEDNKCFIPFDALQLARDPKLVRQTLQHKKSEIPTADVPRILDAVCSSPGLKNGSSFFRVFAVLVLCKNTGSITKFVDLGINDSYLPLPFIRRNGDSIIIRRHKHERKPPLIKKRVLETIFKNQEDWDHDSLSNLNTRQWWVIAPFFGREGSMIPHYVLESSDVFPFTLKKREERPKITDAEGKEEVLDEETPLAKEGGFGDVLIVKIHPSHYDFGKQPYSDGSHGFALKRLKSPNTNDFKLEVGALSKYNQGIDQHLIPLLATIEKEDETSKYYLLFPEANGDLRHFWETKFSKTADKSLLKWMAEQCLGITKALSMLHQDQDADKDEDYPIYGRHGDIKAANILWFAKAGATGPSGWRLVLSDFGLMRFHRLMSRSIQTARNLQKTITYQAPEFDIAKISRKSDIWALGCTFLEFITCYILGYDAVSEDFPSWRGEYDKRLKFDADKFYRTTNDGKWAELKPNVRQWIYDLHDNPKCSPYFHDFLDFIEESMLCIERDKRPAASEVAQSLESLLRKCQDASYLTEQREI